MNVTARDRYGNTVPTGNPGFTLTGSLTEQIVAASLERTVSNGVTRISFTVHTADDYVLRVEDALQELVHQSKLTVVPAGLSYEVSTFVDVPVTAMSGELLHWRMQVRSHQLIC